MASSIPFVPRLGRRALLATATGLGLSGLASAQGAFPSRPIKIVVPWASGGGPDVIGRLMAEPMRESLGQSILIDNKPGGGSMMGSEVVAHSPPDGYTLLLTAGALAVAPGVRRDMTWDPGRDLVGVALVAVVPLFVVVRPESPLRSIADLIALARQRGADVTYATSGIASPPHLIGERLGAEAGKRMTHVPYRGVAQVMPDLLAGTLDFSVQDAVSASPYISTGRIRALAINGTQRSPTFPDVPTLREAGVPFDAVGWHATFAPAATPAPVLAKLNTAIVAALATPRVRDGIRATGALPIDPPLGAGAWTARFRREIVAWGEVARAANITVE
jgi:tripartite-type tricarboxylate transporter receptor subunit TctC